MHLSIRVSHLLVHLGWIDSSLRQSIERGQKAHIKVDHERMGHPVNMHMHYHRRIYHIKGNLVSGMHRLSTCWGLICFTESVSK